MSAILKDPGALEALCERVATAEFVGLDTEFVRERTYYAELALIQLALPDGLVLLDPLAVDITPLGDALQGPGLKIVHAGRQDLELILQETGRLPAPLFDTQVAAALLGFEDQIGYGGLVEKLLEVRLPKDATRTNWASRPLTDHQLRYALDDVRYLKPLHERLIEALARHGRHAWLEEEIAALSDVNLYRFDPAQLTRRYRQGSTMPSPAQARFSALLLWREDAARAANLPRGWILPDAVLVDLAHRPPAHPGEISERRGVDERAARKWSAAVYAALQEAPAESSHTWLPATLSTEQTEIYDALVALIDARAQALGIGASLLGARRTLKEIAQGGPTESLETGWRAEVLGAEGRELLERARRHVKPA